MTNQYSGNVWMVRDYLEDKLKEKEIAIMPFSRIASHSTTSGIRMKLHERNKPHLNLK